MDEKYTITPQQLAEANYQFTYVLKLKNYLRYFIMIAVGLAIMLFMHNIPGIILGVIFIGFPLANILLIKDRPIVELNDEVVIVRDVFSTSIYRFRWEDVEAYGSERNTRGVESTTVSLVGNFDVMIPSSSASLLSEFHKRIPEKEKMTLWKKQMEERKKKREEKRKTQQ